MMHTKLVMNHDGLGNLMVHTPGGFELIWLLVLYLWVVISGYDVHQMK
jgi:hypothetical protein